MRKLAINFVGLFAVSAMMWSCATEPDSDTLADGDVRVSYSVQVVPVGNVDKGLDGATVTIHAQGETRTETVGADGIAVFDNIRPGTISGYVSASGYASINFSANIMKTNVDANTEDFATSTVYMIATNSTLTGRIYGDYDMDGDGTLSDNGNFQAVDLYVSYSIGSYPMGSGNGALNSVSLDVDTYGITTGTNGEFTLANLPTSANGYVSSSYWIADVILTDPVSDFTVIYNIGSNSVSMNPGVTTSAGDLLAN